MVPISHLVSESQSDTRFVSKGVKTSELHKNSLRNI